jgi:riboflavin synthase
MFNGIIHIQAHIKDKINYKKTCLLKLTTNLKFKNSEIGSSIACNGACLTLTKISKKNLFFYLSKETLDKTNFKYAKIGQVINIEKSMKYGDSISGHYVQGHIDTTGVVKKISKIDKTWILKIGISSKYKNLITYKGSIAINGVSLTISKINKNFFEITIIPHTLKLTNLINLKKGNLVNIEFDIFSKYLLKLS